MVGRSSVPAQLGSQQAGDWYALAHSGSPLSALQQGWPSLDRPHVLRRYDGWVTEMQDEQRRHQTAAAGLDNLLYSGDAGEA